VTRQSSNDMSVLTAVDHRSFVEACSVTHYTIIVYVCIYGAVWKVLQELPFTENCRKQNTTQKSKSQDFAVSKTLVCEALLLMLNQHPHLSYGKSYSHVWHR